MSTRMHSAVTAYKKVCKADLRDRLILEHLYYVKHILGKMLGTLPEYVDQENLESAGILGLVEAAGQFDPARETAFTTFAYQRIRGAILDNSVVTARFLRPSVSTGLRFERHPFT